MKTLIFNGSPRPKGDTAGLLGLLKEDLAGEYRQVDAYRAEETARMLLRSMGCRDIHPLVCSHDTNHCPAVRDPQAVAGVRNIAAFFNGEE